jgi:hypothetical protein
MSTDDNTFRRVDWSDDGPLLSDDDDANGMPLLLPRGAGLSDADLELLTLAARALGATVEVVEGEQWVVLHFADGAIQHGWNSLRHGDDALYLAVDLGLQVIPAARTMSGEACVAVAGPAGGRLAEEPSTPDARAATRIVVTRAAAEIGKAMP